jgi:hypothetical protein
MCRRPQRERQRASIVWPHARGETRLREDDLLDLKRGRRHTTLDVASVSVSIPKGSWRDVDFET